LRDVQDAASHADPRTTMRYDRARQSGSTRWSGERGFVVVVAGVGWAR
jgi:hypothetical protein